MKNSDVDVATEMATFARTQILSQTAVSMLAQANSFPHMLLPLGEGAGIPVIWPEIWPRKNRRASGGPGNGLNNQKKKGNVCGHR